VFSFSKEPKMLIRCCQIGKSRLFVHKWDARPRKVTIGSVLSVAIVCPVKARPRRMTTAMLSQ